MLARPPDGVDVVRNVGVLRFSDQDVSVESGLSGVLLEGTPGDDPEVEPVDQLFDPEEALVQPDDLP